jgi:hypothetical protein
VRSLLDRGAACSEIRQEGLVGSTRDSGLLVLVLSVGFQARLAEGIGVPLVGNCAEKCSVRDI